MPARWATDPDSSPDVYPVITSEPCVLLIGHLVNNMGTLLMLLGSAVMALMRSTKGDLFKAGWARSELELCGGAQTGIFQPACVGSPPFKLEGLQRHADASHENVSSLHESTRGINVPGATYKGIG